MRLTKLQKQMIADFTELEFGESIYVTKKNLQEKLRETNDIIKNLVDLHINSNPIEPVDNSLLDSLEQIMCVERSGKFQPEWTVDGCSIKFVPVEVEHILPVDETVLNEAESLLNSQSTFSEKKVTVVFDPVEPSETDLLLQSFGK